MNTCWQINFCPPPLPVFQGMLRHCIHTCMHAYISVYRSSLVLITTFTPLLTFAVTGLVACTITTARPTAVTAAEVTAMAVWKAIFTAVAVCHV